MNKEKFYIVLIVILVNVILVGCSNDNNSVDLTEESHISEESHESISFEQGTLGDVFVYVTGAVKAPGVYCVKNDSRIYQVIEMAGGMTKKAQKDCINLADKVYDGQKIQVMTKKQFKEQKHKSSENTEAETSDFGNNNEEGSKVNINSATSDELTSLPGIGAAKADAIVAFREENGDFSSIEDIKKVSGIGDATFANIESMITVN